MIQKLGYLVLALGLVVPASGAVKPGSISGYVRDASGVPQMGAMVEVLGSASRGLLYTDARGFYSISGLLPGVYNIKVSAPSFLPTLREKVGLRSGASVMVNLTLSTIFDAFQLAPGGGAAEEDDWKWTLRSVANRPILRFDEDPSGTVISSEAEDRALKGRLSFVAGSDSGGYGGASDVNTRFTLEHSLFSSGTLALNGNLAYGNGAPTTVLRTSYSHTLANGSRPEIALTVRRFSAPDPNLHSLQALALTASDALTLGDLVELNFGSELQTIQFMGRVNAFRPFGSAVLHVSPNTMIAYSYATSIPNGRVEKGFDSSPADLSETNPRVSLAGYTPALERARHQEISVSRRMGKTSVQLAAFSDHIANTALVGVGDTSTIGGDILPDIYSGSFTYQGKDLETSGLRFVVERKLNNDLTATFDYGYGGVLDLGSEQESVDSARSAMRTLNRHALSGKLKGTIPHAKTHWIASYRWINGQALTPVDLFNASPGQADPYLNFFIRQPVPSMGFLPAHMEILVELRNLLAEGYVPVLAQDGRTLYLVQSARALRGGVAFNF
jgi:hypothetical protein